MHSYLNIITQPTIHESKWKTRDFLDSFHTTASPNPTNSTAWSRSGSAVGVAVEGEVGGAVQGQSERFNAEVQGAAQWRALVYHCHPSSARHPCTWRCQVLEYVSFLPLLFLFASLMVPLVLSEAGGPVTTWPSTVQRSCPPVLSKALRLLHHSEHHTLKTLPRTGFSQSFGKHCLLTSGADWVSFTSALITVYRRHYKVYCFSRCQAR